MNVHQPRPELEGVAQALERAFPLTQNDAEEREEKRLLRRAELRKALK